MDATNLEGRLEALCERLDGLLARMDRWETSGSKIEERLRGLETAFAADSARLKMLAGLLGAGGGVVGAVAAHMFGAAN